MTTKPKVLCLHGFCRQSEDLKKTGFMKVLSTHYDLVYADAPHQLAEGSRAWFYYDAEEPTKVDWTNIVTADPDKLLGHQESLNYLQNLLAQDPTITAIFGFSQGAAMLSLLAYSNLLPQRITKLIFACGFHPLSQSYNCSLPSLHIMGIKDQTIPNPLSLALLQNYPNGVLVKHEGTHVIDVKACYKSQYKNFLIESHL